MSVEEAIREAVTAGLTPLRDELRAIRGELQQLRAEAKAAPAPDPDQRLHLPIAAELAGKHPDTLRRAIKAKKLKANRVDGGREWLVRRADLEAYIAGRKPDELTLVDEQRKIAEHVRRARKTG